MIRHVCPIITGLAALSVVLTTIPVAAQPSEALPAGNAMSPPVEVERADMYRLVKHFDFDERKLGNYEDWPMNWVQLQGEGLPTLYAKGRFDDEVGHDAAPSFRLEIKTGNVAYEYRHLDLVVIPKSDYFIVGYTRAAELAFSAAFVAAYFVDRFGERIPGSERISRLVRATGRDPEPWQRVEIDLPGEFPLAYALRLQFWILQDFAWRQPDPHEIDPIPRRDVYGTAWFDDFSIYRLPRVQLHFSNPAGLVLPGRREEFVLEVNNATSQPLRAELRVTDGSGQLRYTQELDVPPTAGPVGFVPSQTPSARAGDAAEVVLAMDQQGLVPAVRAAVPDLAPGLYTARLRLLGGSETLLERETRFAVLPELARAGSRRPDVGVDLGPWPGGNVAGLRELLSALGCGAVKVGIPMVGDLIGEDRAAHFQRLSTLLRVLAADRVEATGVILTPSAAEEPEAGDPTRTLVARTGVWHELFGPILAHFGALLPTWQLGAEAIELRKAGQWQPEEVERVRILFRDFITIPKLVVPQPLSAVSPSENDIASVWLPAHVPARALPRLLKFLADGNASSYWLHVEVDRRPGLGGVQRANDLARRLALAKALNPGRIFVPAPFELSRGGGRPAWQPTDDFLVLRTLYHYLAGKTAVGAMTPASDVLAILFEGVDANCMVVWTWREKPLAEPLELYLGPNPRAVDLWARPVPLEVREGRTRLPVGPTPLIVSELHAPLALLQASYRIAPNYVQIHQSEPRPVVTFRNPYDQRLSGEVRLTPPGNWQVEPTVVSFLLEPGETFAEPLTLTLPPRQIAQIYKLDVLLRLHAPESMELRFPEALTVGLLDIGLDASMYWKGDDLVVEQALRNLSDQPVNFDAFCEAPGRARQERFFDNVAPGEVSIQTYLFPDSRDLSGAQLSLGIQEIDGERALNQFAEVPR